MSAVSPRRRWQRWALIGALPALLLLFLAVAWGREGWLAGNFSVDTSIVPSYVPPDKEEQLRRGATLARIGNCAGCHTARGGAPMAGGEPLRTPFGSLRGGNLTPDPDTGLGRWTAAEFWGAMHLGRSRDGRLLYPAFPYPSFTGLSRADSDALFVWLQSLPPVRQRSEPPALDWPYDSPTALAVWRLLYFRPGDRGLAYELSAPTATPEQRGRYLVETVGHCAECHAPRNRLGALRDAPGLGGGRVAGQGWIAPSLSDPAQAGVQDWTEAEVVAWLRRGASSRGAALGPMADVVFDSLQHLSDADATAIARHLRALPRVAAPTPVFKVAPAPQLALGAKVYARHCAECHGDAGQGRRLPGATANGGDGYPSLVGNRTVLLTEPDNLLQVLARGGYAPATAANPRPLGMPPLRQVLSDEEMAAVASFVRQSWGHRAGPVTGQDVLKLR